MFVKFFYLFLLTRLTGPAADSLFQLHRNKKDPAEHSHAPQDLPNFSFPNLNGMLSHILPGISAAFSLILKDKRCDLLISLILHHICRLKT